MGECVLCLMLRPVCITQRGQAVMLFTNPEMVTVCQLVLIPMQVSLPVSGVTDTPESPQPSWIGHGDRPGFRFLRSSH